MDFIVWINHVQLILAKENHRNSIRLPDIFSLNCFGQFLHLLQHSKCKKNVSKYIQEKSDQRFVGRIFLEESKKAKEQGH